MKYLLCVYTCDREPYRSHLQELRSQDWFKKLERDPEVSVYYVYADASLAEPRLDGGKLTLPCSEDYTQLARKTYEMIRYFVGNEEFDYLIKLDDSIMTAVRERWSRMSPCIRFVQSLKKRCRGEYSSPIVYRFTLNRTKRWTNRKGLPPVSMPKEYTGFLHGTGKIYALNFKACKAVASANESLIHLFHMHAYGAEDALVGKIIYDKFPAARRKMYRAYIMFYLMFLTRHTYYLITSALQRAFYPRCVSRS